MDSDVASRKIFIGGLSYGTDDEKLKQYFQQFGAVHDAVVMKDPISRRSRGFGFITYEQASFVDVALAREIHTIDSRQVEAKRAVPRSETRDVPPKSATISSAIPNQSNFIPSSPSQQSLGHASSSSATSTPRHDNISSSTKIFVGGLHYDTRDVEFRNYFEKFGKVVNSEVMFNRETHKSRGFGFIVFDSERSVDDVCAEKEHFIDGKLVEVKRAVPRSKIASMSPSGSQPPPSPTSYSGKQSTSLFHGANQIPSLGSRSSDIDNLENFSLTPDRGTLGPSSSSGLAMSSYAAALKSGSQPQPAGDHSPSPQSFLSHQYEPSPYSSQQQPQHGGILSEPVNVTDYHLRGHANSLSELDLHNSSHFSFGQYDQQQQHHFHSPFHTQQQQLQHQQMLHHQYSPHGSHTHGHHQYGNSPVTPNNSPIGPPLSIPSRHRALTESYLMMMQSPSSSASSSHHLHNHHHRQPIYQRASPQSHSSATATATASASFGKLNPNVPNFTPEYLKQAPQELTEDHHLMLSHQPRAAMSPIQHLNQGADLPPPSPTIASTRHWESFESQRGSLERSVSLGWAPTSITSPSRRGMSDVGLTDLQITFDTSSPDQHHSSSPSSLFQTQTAALSEEAWSSLIDLNMGELHNDPTVIGPNDSTFSELDPHDKSLVVQFHYRDYASQSQHQPQTQSLQEEGDEVQELRLQAREFIPRSHHQQFHQQQQQWPTSNPAPPLPASPSSTPSSPSINFK